MQNQPTLTTSTMTPNQSLTEQQTEPPQPEGNIQVIEPNSNEILKYFNNYEKNHFVVHTETYLSLLGVNEAYKNPSKRTTFLDNKTSYLSQLSDDRIAVYKREASYGNIEILICIRGTRITDIRDIYDDIRVINGSIRSSPYTIQYVEKCIEIRNAFNNIPNDQIYISGHSLSAVSSLLSSFILKCNGFGFNGAQSLVDYNDKSVDILGNTYNLNGIYNYSKYINYALRGDPIALTSRFRISNTIIINVEKLNNMNAIQLHRITTMINIMIPYIPLEKGSVSNARRFIRNNETTTTTPTPTALDALKSQRTTVENPQEDNNEILNNFRKYITNVPILNLF